MEDNSTPLFKDNAVRFFEPNAENPIQVNKMPREGETEQSHTPFDTELTQNILDKLPSDEKREGCDDLSDTVPYPHDPFTVVPVARADDTDVCTEVSGGCLKPTELSRQFVGEQKEKDPGTSLGNNDSSELEQSKGMEYLREKDQYETDLLNSLELNDQFLSDVRNRDSFNDSFGDGAYFGSENSREFNRSESYENGNGPTPPQNISSGCVHNSSMDNRDSSPLQTDFLTDTHPVLSRESSVKGTETELLHNDPESVPTDHNVPEPKAVHNVHMSNSLHDEEHNDLMSRALKHEIDSNTMVSSDNYTDADLGCPDNDANVNQNCSGNSRGSLSAGEQFLQDLVAISGTSLQESEV